MVAQFKKFDIQPIPREENLWADLLSKFSGVADGKNERVITWLLSNTSAIDLDMTPCGDVMEIDDQKTSWVVMRGTLDLFDKVPNLINYQIRSTFMLGDRIIDLTYQKRSR